MCEKTLKISWTQVETGSAGNLEISFMCIEGDNSIGEFYSIAVTNNFQQADTGTKNDSICKTPSQPLFPKGFPAGKSQNSYRGLVQIGARAENASVTVTM